jgi:hypothetical protein
MRLEIVCGLLSVFLALITPARCLADEYILIMSKDKSVCQNMLRLYNDDLRKSGEIQYEEHEEYTSIKWEEKKAFGFYQGVKNYEYMLMSIFDINNDGKEEIVTKWTGYLRGYPKDTLHIFSKKDLDLFASDFDLSLISKQIGNIGIDEPIKRMLYELTEMPSMQVEVSGKKNDINYSVGPLFSFQPFRFKGKYYIEMRDDYGNPGGEDFLVILQYLKAKKFRDVCYYIKIKDCVPKRKEDK